ncbi:MAG: hypothetical protein ACOX7B_07680 [Christensenellales bacterium]|jgi:hypothetical protein
MLKLSYRLLSLLLALVLLPGHSLAASRSLPIEEDYAFFLMGDGQTAYVGTMNGLLFRFRAGHSQLEPLPLIEDRGRTDTIMGMCCIDGGVYYVDYDTNVLHLMYAEKEGLPETIAIPVREVKGGHSGSHIKHMVYDGAALWLMMDARNNDQYVLCRFGLKQNAMKAFDQSRGLHGFALLGDGRVALGFSMYEKEKVFGRLCILDTATGKTSQQLDIPERPEAMAFDKARNAVLYISQSKLWSWPMSGPPQVLRNMPVNGNGWSNPGIIMEGGLLSVHQNGLFLADPQEVSAGQLHILGESPGFDYFGGNYGTFMNLRPDVDLSFQMQIDPNQSVNTGELGQRIQTGMLPFDVMLMDTQQYNLPALVQKGYCMDLSGEEDLMAAVQEMHPSIQNQVMMDGKLYAIPLRVDGMDVLCYYEKFLQEIGMTRADLPQSFEALIQWAGSWPRSLGDQVRPMEATNLAALLKANFLTHFINYRYSQHGSLDFTDPAFINGLQLIDSQRMPKYSEQMPFVLSEGSSDLMDEDIIVLSLTEDGAKVQPARLFVYFINSQTENPELALDYVRTAVQHMKPEFRAALYPSWTEPVEHANYPFWLEEMAQEEALLRSAVAKEGATAAGRDAQARLDAHLARVEELRPGYQYKITQSELRFYQQQVAPYLFFPPVNPFTNYYEPGGESIDKDLRRYIQGQQSAQAFAQSLQQKARLMELEGK